MQESFEAITCTDNVQQKSTADIRELTLSDFFSGLSTLLAVDAVALGCLNDDCDGTGTVAAAAAALRSSSC